MNLPQMIMLKALKFEIVKRSEMAKKEANS